MVVGYMGRSHCGALLVSEEQALIGHDKGTAAFAMDDMECVCGVVCPGVEFVAATYWGERWIVVH
jgi:hypothetical protein